MYTLRPVHISYNALGVWGGVQISLCCVIIREAALESVLFNAFCYSDSASIFHRFISKLITAPKSGGVSKIPHPHAAHLP